jgi:hypothetical protein
VTNDIRIEADEAKRLKKDTAFMRFVGDVREDQMRVFANSEASEIDAREEAHAIIRALNKIEMFLDAAIAAEAMLDRKQRKG